VDVHKLRLGTRGSPLALAQARDVARRLAVAQGLGDDAVVIEVIKTSGDRIQDRPLSEVGGKGLFTKELEEALLSGAIDLAVHSMKDVATTLPDELEIAATLEREDPRDAFISRKFPSFAALPSGATVGTSSLRRQAQVLQARPDLRVVPFRGNVETRLKKLEEGVADATFLAVAGLKRLGMTEHITEAMAVEAMLPAVAQGAVSIEVRAGDERTRSLVAVLDHRPTRLCVEAERAFLARLDGSCRTPIAGHAQLAADEQLRFSGEILTPDGRRRHTTTRAGTAADARALGDDAGRALLSRAEPGFFGRAG
jgi:hydroxymethylbilane synthase